MSRSRINALKVRALFAVPLMLAAGIGYAVADSAGAIVCAAASVVLALIIFRNADRMVLKQHGATLLSENAATGVHTVVSGLAGRTGVSKPNLYLISDPQPNLLVWGTKSDRSAIGLSPALLDLLSTEELAGVVGNAIHHIHTGETGPMTVLAAMVGVMIQISNIFRWSNLLGSKLVRAGTRDGASCDAFLWVLIAPVAAALVRTSLHRSRHFRADAAGAHLIGDATPLCAALRKIQARADCGASQSVSLATVHLFVCDPLSGANGSNMFRTHPKTGERLRRLVALGEAIDYFGRVIEIGPTLGREMR